MKHFINKIKSSFLVKKLEKLLNRVKSSAIVKNDGKNFLHFFVAFTVIFAALTIIILQVMNSGIYKETDQNLQSLWGNPAFQENITNSQKQVSTNLPLPGNYGPNTSFIFYDTKGKMQLPNSNESGMVTQDYGQFAQNLGLLERKVQLTPSQIGEIHTLTVLNPYGGTLHYRYLTMGILSDPNTLIGYVQIFTNIDQLQESTSRSNLIIITTLAAFWLLSVVISLYLANWTLRPIMLAYERQKEFVENASHELRTPLAILQNRLELLFQKPTATIIDESENISESLSEVRNMRLLTTNLLNLARRDSGIKIEPEETKADFFEGIFASYGMLAENAEKGFDGSVKLEGSVQLDQSLVKQLLTILFDNALKYTNDDGKIAIDVQKVGGNLNLTVSDNGDGISDEDKKRIFDRFFRVDKARTRQKGGLGLGLSLAKQIVDAYNGKISVEDNQPKGVKFIVRLRLDNQIVNPANIFKKL